MTTGVYVRTKPVSDETKKKMSEAKKGVPRSIETRKKISEAHIGIKHSEETKEKMSKTRLKSRRISYNGIHSWIERKLGKPQKCENTECKYPRMDGNQKIMLEPKRYHWANIDHEYRREVSDWIRLCVSCHRLYDNGKIKLIINK